MMLSTQLARCEILARRISAPAPTGTLPFRFFTPAFLGVLGASAGPLVKRQSGSFAGGTPVPGGNKLPRNHNS
jgi:hypothetical protein